MQHRIKNNLQLLSGMLKLQANDEQKEGVSSVIRENESRVNAMAIVHQLLYAEKDKREIDSNKYIVELCDYLKKAFTNQESEISIQTQVANIEIDVDKMVAIGLVINELITNAINHAFKGVQNPEIHLRFIEMESGNLLLEVRDNGTGFDEKNVNPASFGLRLIKMLSRQLNAEINTFNERGAVFQFSLSPK